jgi:hypothetical protein
VLENMPAMLTSVQYESPLLLLNQVDRIKMPGDADAVTPGTIAARFQKERGIIMKELLVVPLSRFDVTNHVDSFHHPGCRP